MENKGKTKIKNLIEEIKVFKKKISGFLKSQAEYNKTKGALLTANQQLRASEQQLKAANHQLKASEQQLRAEIIERKEAEDEIRESRIKLQVLYDSSSDAIMLLDEKGFFDCNNATLRLFGCATKEEFCSKHPADFSPPTQPDGTDSMSYARNNIARALKEGSIRFEHLHRRLDGTDFPAQVLLDKMTLGGKEVLQARVFDITERKKADMKLRASERQYRFLADNTADCIWMMDKDLRFTYINPAIFPMLGYTPEEWIGTTLTEHCSAEDIKKTLTVITETFKNKGSYNATYEMSMNHKDGRMISVEIHGKILLDKNKNPAGFSGITRDITKRKKANEEIRRMATIVEQAAEGIAVANIEGDIQFVNHAWAAMHGYKSSDKLIGKHLSIFHTKEQLKTDVILFNEEAKQSGHKIGEVGHMRKDGTTFPTMMMVTLLKNEQGKPYGFAGFAQDITERKKADAELQKRLKELEIFFKASTVREERILELKKEVKRLEEELNKVKKK